jgi:hypothetical protein
MFTKQRIAHENMKHLIFAITALLMLTLSSYKGQTIEDEKYLNFISALKNKSTFNYFTVVKVKDVNSGVTKEICTKGNFVSGALHIELNADYDSRGRQRVLNFAKSKKDRYFEFKNRKALDNISFFQYDSNYLGKVQKKFNFDSIAKSIERDKKFSIGLPDNEMAAFAHILFNRGIMSGESDCFGGTLECFNRTKTNNSIK